ncbi:hypothetical protein [Bacillus taeanensis]|uniref:DUF2642 domain-containing protein n=1 Tax=Bacillus taeanensis TaxID=273032 RepID=A0A366Y3P8_9BACI|nr:hypothetical protein [Bacillus taeanensis]RBW70811.1 hypothetical protein DS031_04880 [Bacillus taeanensis]
MRFNSGFPQINLPSINDIHDEALIVTFREAVGKKVLIITPSFPYVFIGRIIEMVEDFVVVDVNVTIVSELENRIWKIHVHRIEAFYIERKGQPKIPDLKDDF